MSAVPEDFMRGSTKSREGGSAPVERPDPESEDSGGSFWQWLAIGVLIGCWLAEATWCMENGF
jgi:hypothetical protein